MKADDFFQTSRTPLVPAINATSAMQGPFFVKPLTARTFSGWMLYMSADAEKSTVTSLSLLERLKDWSQQTAWREFDHDYAPLLRNVECKAGLSDAEAKDVAQQTLIVVAQKIGAFQHNGNRGAFRAWLFRQLRWRIVDQFRLRERTGGLPFSAVTGFSAEHHDDMGVQNLDDIPRAEMPPLAEGVFEKLWDAEWKEHFWQCALALVKKKVTSRQFQLFDLHVLQGLSVSASAKAGSTVAAVYTAKSRVGRKLKRELVKVMQE
jgi:RNA polymerase sigma-70 factor (ECF subfamily)